MNCKIIGIYIHDSIFDVVDEKHNILPKKCAVKCFNDWYDRIQKHQPTCTKSDFKFLID